MSIISRRDYTNGFSLIYCDDEGTSEQSSDSDYSFVTFEKEKVSRNNSFEKSDSIVYDSANVSFESPNFKDYWESKVLGATRKRRRISSSSETSLESRSRSASPEIAYGGTPVAYKLQEFKGQLLIIKKPMSTSRVRPKKCSDNEIVDLLNTSSDEELMFDEVEKSGAKIVGSLGDKSKDLGASKTMEKTPKRVSRRTYTESKENASMNTPSKLHREDEGQLKIKLRRSTEQSNYKIESNYDNGERRVSKRANMGTPKKCGMVDCDEDHSVHKKTRGTTPKTPKRSEILRSEEKKTPIGRITRRNSSIIKDCETIFENNDIRDKEEETHDDVENDSGNRIMTRQRRMNRILETPESKLKRIDDTTTPRSARLRRRSKLVNYNYDGEEIIGNKIRDKENKQEESDNDDDDSRERGGTRLQKTATETPKKHSKLMDEKRTPRRNAMQKLGEATPKRTPRRATMRKIDEPSTPSTPQRKPSKIGTPSIKNSCLTPSMSRRTANIGKPITLLEEARAKLHVSAVPKSLPCREEEFNDIYQFLERKLLDNNSGCIYISGVPGTGKTATVNEVIRCLKKLVTKGDLNNFDYIEINGMKLSEPRQAYVQILKQINGQAKTWEQSLQILEKRFTHSSAKRPMTLLLVDELDLLCNKRQDVVYNLLDWPAKANAQLVVITIANTMDLPERVLMGRVTSRLGLTRLTFQPYNHKQLQEIVMTRLKDSDAFKSEAIQLVARKVAAVSGDARRALDICRRATEIAESNESKIVSMQEVNQALTEMIASAKVQAIKHCSEMEKIFLQAVCTEVTRTGVEETNFHNVYRQMEAMCSFEGMKIPNVTQALGICGRLGANRLLLCEHSRSDTHQRILLNVSSDDIHFAMQKIAVS